ncbi:hypothetical protein BVX93_02295 [bacterium B13(2017)]|nr:hypothetical protein BVX93_02295 [bacterium B13(2017)]
MKIGIDFHGVIDEYPRIFSKLTKKWYNKGFEIHIITGKEWSDVEPKLKKYNISFTHHYSIVDYHKQMHTNMKKKRSGWWMDEEIWNKSKGIYCKRKKVTLHFDNDLIYAKWFPENCTFVWVRKKNFKDFLIAIEKI